MRADDIVLDRDKSLVGARSTLDPRLFANVPDPFVAAHRCIAGLPGLLVFPTARQDVRPPTEQAPEQRDLRVRRRGHRNDCRGSLRPDDLPRRPGLLKQAQSRADVRPFPIKGFQSVLQRRDLAGNVVKTGNRVVSSNDRAVSKPCPVQRVKRPPGLRFQPEAMPLRFAEVSTQPARSDRGKPMC